MNIFIDCEFNGFKGELITMALVTTSGKEWYKSVPWLEPTDPWVAEHVIPVMGDVDCLSRAEFSRSLELFLDRYDNVHVIADWPDDIRYFMDVLIAGPGDRIDTPPLTCEVLRDLEGDSEIPHNALFDARANLKYFKDKHES